MVRVVLGGEDLAAFPDTPVQRPLRQVAAAAARGGRYPEPFDARDASARSCPASSGRSCGPTRCAPSTTPPGELTIDFVAPRRRGRRRARGPLAARPGDVLRFMGPGGAYAPDPGRGLVPPRGRRESALPAIGAALRTRSRAGRARAGASSRSPTPAEHQKLAGDARRPSGCTAMPRAPRPARRRRPGRDVPARPGSTRSCTARPASFGTTCGTCSTERALERSRFPPRVAVDLGLLASWPRRGRLAGRQGDRAGRSPGLGTAFAVRDARESSLRYFSTGRNEAFGPQATHRAQADTVIALVVRDGTVR